MIQKFIIILSLVLFPLMGMAQETYTDYLQRRIAGRGIVVLHQDDEITNLVNGGVTKSRTNTNGSLSGEMDDEEEETPAVAPSGRHTTANGYRVQIISLGSTAKDKAKAEALGRQFKNVFPATNVYITFRSPHYICTVGDYKTREEASEMLRQMRETRLFGSASVVRSKINVYY